MLMTLALAVLFFVFVAMPAKSWYDENYPIRRIRGNNMGDLKSCVRGSTLLINGERFRIVRWQSATVCWCRRKMLPGRWWL